MSGKNYLVGIYDHSKEKFEAKKDIEISYGKNILSVGSPSLKILGKGEPDNTRIEASLKIENIHATVADASEIILPQADLQAFFNLEKKFPQENLVAGNFEVKGS